MKISFALEQRLRMVDFLLANYGHVNRRALEDYFGIQCACATRDFQRYMGIAPNNMAYNSNLKSYSRTEAFKRVYD